MKNILEAPFMVEAIRTLTNLYRLGWDERNGGNLSVLLDEGEVGEFLDTGAVKLHFLTVCDPEDLRPGAFELAGRSVRFDPELSVEVERLDASEPETVEIPERWDTDAIRRITLTSSAPVKAKTYTLTVE